MLDKILFGSKAIEKSLDASLKRNEVIAQNIANVDTPGYSRKTVSFEEQLSDAISQKSRFIGKRTDPRHIPIGASSVDDVQIQVTKDNKSLDMRLDGNNVDIENEMSQMAENNIRYEVLIQRMSGVFNKMKSVIREGR